MDQSLVFIIMGVVVLIGLLATVVYYFSRYFFVTHDKDNEVFKKNVDVSAVEKKLDSNAEKKVANDAAPPTKPAAAAPQQLSNTLKNTRDNFWGRIKRSLTSGDSLGSIDKDILEEILYTSDMGTATVQVLMEEVGDELKAGPSGSALDALKKVLKSKMSKLFSATDNQLQKLWAVSGDQKPTVWMIVGVNGAGKTTTIGKLARYAVEKGRRVLIVPGDTFRVAASDQLKVWADRVNEGAESLKAEFYDVGKTTDPSGVAYEAVQFGKSKDFDLIIVDTAGRLHTQDPLMEELKKIKRVIGQVLPGAPHQTLIVLDANSGQNALAQAVAFHTKVELSGVVISKLDGTAKGGVVLGVVNETHLPVLFVGVGEKIEDLKEFSSTEFVDSIFS